MKICDILRRIVTARNVKNCNNLRQSCNISVANKKAPFRGLRLSVPVLPSGGIHLPEEDGEAVGEPAQQGRFVLVADAFSDVGDVPELSDGQPGEVQGLPDGVQGLPAEGLKGAVELAHG